MGVYYENSELGRPTCVHFVQNMVVRRLTCVLFSAKRYFAATYAYVYSENMTTGRPIWQFYTRNP